MGADSPVPDLVVAVRHSKTIEQMHRVVHLSPKKRLQYQGRVENWAEKLSAALIFLAVRWIYYSGDAIEIDIDFQRDRRRQVEAYLAKLFSVKFMGNHPMNSPAISSHSKRESVPVKIADKKCELARQGKLPTNFEDPELTADMSLLPRTI